MRFTCNGQQIDCAPAHLVVAGWTGRDAAAVQHHIDELAALGVAPPSTVPLFYRCAPSLLTQAPRVAMLGTDSSGEAEPLVLVAQNGQRYLGLGSDHTDRKLETVSVAASKQLCAKPVAQELWLWEEVAGHLDLIEVTCDIHEGGDWLGYQRGTLAGIRPLDALIAGAGLEALARDGGAAMLCGTFAALGGVRPSARIRMRMHDPVRDRRISLGYEVEALAVVA
ncbi:DUF2848 domain-containing protein [Paracoccus sanguinis]|uniref:DUF2848 domain-containing protein n=1 Tax=Paracoccus sanguinis TaxID=1545044 RepID=A0A1H2W1Z5_9RHOB|nr:DUF2848 domain-containing protein [Paracoccus sanguinis]KGJ17717.1 hypothetical protein IX57_07280 [Paracoccus sanguinis]SDW74119.1 Protein of unknown function [Paracoccus sanguinis]